MSSIPEELYHEILVRLSVKSLLVCKSVCKIWFQLISNPSFINAHLNLTAHRNYFLLARKYSFSAYTAPYVSYALSKYTAYSLSYESLNKRSDDAVDKFYKVGSIDGCQADLLCSCNGLVCINYRINNQRFILLWNPATREYKELPQPPTNQDLFDLSSALGYDYKVNDYKFVVIVQFDERTTEILVYTLGSNSWKKIQNISCKTFKRHCGIPVNGAFHWIGRQPEDHSRSKLIFSFDISNERSNVIQLPKKALDEGGCISVGLMEGCLCIVAFHYFFDDPDDPAGVCKAEVIVWVMQEYGVTNSWSKLYVINDETILDHHNLNHMWCFENGEILFDFSGCGESGDTVIYDPTDGSVKEPNLHGLQNICYEQGSCFETLVSLNSGMYVGENGHVELSSHGSHTDPIKKKLRID